MYRLFFEKDNTKTQIIAHSMPFCSDNHLELEIESNESFLVSIMSTFVLNNAVDFLVEERFTGIKKYRNFSVDQITISGQKESPVMLYIKLIRDETKKISKEIQNYSTMSNKIILFNDVQILLNGNKLKTIYGFSLSINKYSSDFILTSNKEQSFSMDGEYNLRLSLTPNIYFDMKANCLSTFQSKNIFEYDFLVTRANNLIVTKI